MKKIKLGSLFDGSGGFPLGGLLAGIEPVWASEIEPFPIRVTTKRLPFVKHYGDVNRLHGDEIEPVDIITFGSPCTDLSIAGKRKGLEGRQSGLFHQAIRVIKEMRHKTNGNYPKFIVFENVPRRLFQQQRRRLPGRPRRDLPYLRSRSFNFWMYKMATGRVHLGRWVLSRLASIGRRRLGRAPKKKTYLSCRASCWTLCRQSII